MPAVFKSPPTDRRKNHGDWDWKDTFVDQVLLCSRLAHPDTENAANGKPRWLKTSVP